MDQGEFGQIGLHYRLYARGLLVVVVVFMSQIRRTFLNLRGETVTVNLPAAPGSGLDTVAVDLKIITVLGKDGIPAILDPSFFPQRLPRTTCRPTKG